MTAQEQIDNYTASAHNIVNAPGLERLNQFEKLLLIHAIRHAILAAFARYKKGTP
jgi:hypothetical protein